jgi:hypothetical protein
LVRIPIAWNSKGIEVAFALLLKRLSHAPIVLDLALFLDLAQRTGMKGVQEWLSFYFKSPMTAPGLYPEYDVFIQLMKLKNTLRHLRGEDLITLGSSITTEDHWSVQVVNPFHGSPKGCKLVAGGPQTTGERAIDDRHPEGVQGEWHPFRVRID